MIFPFLGYNQLSFNWSHTYGNIQDDRSIDFCVTNTGDIIQTGVFTGTVDFDPTSGVDNRTSSPSSSENPFIQKIDEFGNVLWTRTFNSSFMFISAIACDKNGDIYLTGQFYNTVDFDPGAGTSNISAVTTDAFLLSIDASGNFKFAEKLSGPGINSGKTIYVDELINIYITGSFNDSIDLDPSVSTNYVSTVGGKDIFIAKYDGTGSLTWGKSIGCPTNNIEEAYAINVNSIGEVFIGGMFWGTMDVDPGPGVVSITGTIDGFILKLDATGNYSNVYQVGSSGPDYIRDIDFDPNGNIYAVGSFLGTVDFDPSPSSSTLTSIGNDAFALKLKPNMTFSWVKGFLGSGNNQLYKLSVNNNGLVYLGGQYDGVIDLDPQPTTFYDTSTTMDIFLAGLDTSGNYNGAITLGGNGIDNLKGIYGYDNGSMLFNGSFEDTVNFSNNDTVYRYAKGNDDAFITKWTTQNTFSYEFISACNQYVFPSGTDSTTVTGVFYDTILNVAGYDSIMTLDVTVGQTTYVSISTSSCETYLSPSGKIFDSTAVYKDTILNASMCDSIITIALVIYEMPDTNIVTNGDTLVSQAIGMTYQWLDCANSYSVISGETNQKFVPSTGGSYAVEVTNGSCVDTSICIASTVGLNQLVKEIDFSVYPNPASETLNIKGLNAPFFYKIYSCDGRIVYQENNSSKMITIDYLRKGTYLLEVTSSEGKQLTRFIKN